MKQSRLDSDAGEDDEKRINERLDRIVNFLATYLRESLSNPEKTSVRF